MNEQIRVLGFAGSLRQGSYNRALLQAALEVLPNGAKLNVFELDGIPPFSDDLVSTAPEKVKGFKREIKAADALLIVTPEYNYSVPGVLKNAIDWASRPPEDNAFEGKPVAMMSASTGMLGGARAQYHLRQSFVFLNMYAVNKPEVFVSFASQKFDSKGRLLDEKAKELIRELLGNLIALTKRLKIA